MNLRIGGRPLFIPRRGRMALSGLLWPLGIAAGAMLGVLAGGSLSSSVQDSGGDAAPVEAAQAAENTDPAGAGAAGANAPAGATVQVENDLLVSHDELIFFARSLHHRIWPYDFSDATVTLELINASPVDLEVLPFAQDVRPVTSTLASTPPGQVPMVIEDGAGATTLLGTALPVAAGNIVKLAIRPGRVEHTGVYRGAIKLRVRPGNGEADAFVKTIPVKVVTTHLPWLPLLTVTAGVLVATWIVFSRTVGQEKTLIMLRASGLGLRLRQFRKPDPSGAPGKSGRMSRQFDARCRDMLQQAMRNWEQQNVSAAVARLDACEAAIEDYAAAAVIAENVEAALELGSDEFVADGQEPRPLAGTLLLKQAQTSLAVGDTAHAKTFADHAMQVYFAAFRLYQRHKHKREVLHELLASEDRLADARVMVDRALERVERLISILSYEDGVSTDEAESGLERLDFWQRALAAVSDAMRNAPADCESAQRRLDRAAELLASATLVNVRVPRTDAHEDNLLKAEKEARAARSLCEAQPLLDLLQLWCPVNDGSAAAAAAAEAAAQEDAAKVLGAARKAVALLQLNELERASWRWPEADPRHERLKRARDSVAGQQFEAALNQLPWEVSYKSLAAMLLCERMLLAAALGQTFEPGDTDDDDPGTQIMAAKEELNQAENQEALAKHGIFELGLLSLDQFPAVATAWKAARAALNDHKPFLAQGTIKRILDETPVQQQVAEALLSEAELVNHQPGDTAWEAMEAARDMLERRAWTGALWQARSAWILSREALADCYIDEVQQSYVVGEGEQREERDVILPGTPAAAELAAAIASRDAGSGPRAVYAARAAYQSALPRLAERYLAMLPGGSQAAQRAAQLATAGDHAGALQIGLAVCARRKVAEAKKKYAAHPACATAVRRLERGEYFRACRAAAAVLAEPSAAAAPQAPVATDLSCPEEPLDFTLQSFDMVFWRAGPLAPVSRQRQQQVSAEIRLLNDRVRQFHFPAQLQKLVTSCVADAQGATSPVDALNRTARQVDFLEENAGRIRLMSTSGAPQLEKLKTILDAAATGDGAEARAQLETAVVPPEPSPVGMTLVCANAGVELKESREKVRSQVSDFFHGLTGGILNPPRFDEESSVDDPFVFQARVSGGDAAVRERLEYRWTIEHQVCCGGRTWTAAGGDAEARFDLNTHGVMQLTCTVTDPDSAVPDLSVTRFFLVRRSPLRTALRLLSWNSILEVAFVVVIASLLGLVARFFAEGVETFGSLADYVLAFIWGATSKYGQEGFKSLTGLLPGSLARKPPSAAAPPAGSS